MKLSTSLLCLLTHFTNASLQTPISRQGPGATGPGLKDPSLSPDHEPKDIGSAKANFAPDQHNGPQLTRRGQSSTASPSDYSRKLDPFVWIDRVIFQYSHAGLPIYHIVDTMARFVSGWVWPKKSEEDADPGVDSKNEVNQELYRRFEELQRNRTETMRLEDWNIRVVWINRTGQVWPWLSRSQRPPSDVSVVQEVDDESAPNPFHHWVDKRFSYSLLKSYGLTSVLEFSMRDEYGHGIFGFSFHIWQDDDWTEEMEQSLSFDARAEALLNWRTPQEAPPPLPLPSNQPSAVSAPTRQGNPWPRPRLSTRYRKLLGRQRTSV